MGEVLTVLPFSNTLATFQLSGADLIASLENGLSQIEEIAGRFPQVAGLKYTFDKSQPAGSRLVGDVLVADGDNWVPIDPAATYGIVTNNYVRGGGDGYRGRDERHHARASAAHASPLVCIGWEDAHPPLTATSARPALQGALQGAAGRPPG